MGEHKNKATSTQSKQGLEQNTKILSPPKEVFVNGIVNGLTQRQAYLKAYPKRTHWKDYVLDNKASLLWKEGLVRERYQQLLTDIRKNEQDNTMWTREESIATLRFVIDKNKNEVERIHEAAEEELTYLIKKIQEDPEHAEQYAQLILNKRKQRRMSGVHNGGIVSAVAELNKMQGFNEETINLNGSVVFEGEGELED